MVETDGRGSGMMLTILRIIFACITIGLCCYTLVANDVQFLAYIILFGGLSALISSIEYFRDGYKFKGWIEIIGFSLISYLLYLAVTLSY